jgi:hypothetical protein
MKKIIVQHFVTSIYEETIEVPDDYVLVDGDLDRENILYSRFKYLNYDKVSDIQGIDHIFNPATYEYEYIRDVG